MNAAPWQPHADVGPPKWTLFLGAGAVSGTRIVCNNADPYYPWHERGGPPTGGQGSWKQVFFPEQYCWRASQCKL